MLSEMLPPDVRRISSSLLISGDLHPRANRRRRPSWRGSHPPAAGSLGGLALRLVLFDGHPLGDGFGVGDGFEEPGLEDGRRRRSTGASPQRLGGASCGADHREQVAEQVETRVGTARTIAIDSCTSMIPIAPKSSGWTGMMMWSLATIATHEQGEG